MEESRPPPMTVRVLTSSLLGVLADLARTADTGPDAGQFGAVLLHTCRGHHGAEPGKLELLAGASTDRHTAGHTHTPCSGQLGEPTLWSLRDIKSVITVFKAARGRDPHNTHAVQIHRSGGEITIREDPNLIDEGVSLAFGELDAGDYPAPGLYTMLGAAPPGAVVLGAGGLQLVPATPRTAIPYERLVPFTAVARRRGDIVQLYRHHQHARILVQIGDAYRGVLAPVRLVDEAVGDETAPDTELYPPDLGRWRPRDPPDGDGRPDRWQQLDLDDLAADDDGAES
ncbi:hypothetical protein ACFQE5_04765 [Pseudonocardia hispaniensis]|uniref:Uncharacterized protein n=1 Tax=Pseudonocardia hispaniensis TaxID=904933 RepID=A0ABW1IYN7_9PSEU